MKKKIGLSVIIVIEIVLMLIYELYALVGSPAYLEFIYNIGKFYDEKVIESVAKLIQLEGKSFGNLLAFVLINVVFIILYYCIFCTISLIVKKARKKKIERVVKIHHQLNETERERFNYRKYMKRFPLKRFFSLLIPGLFLTIFAFARFDEQFSATINANDVGIFHVYTKYMEPIMIDIFNGTDVLVNCLIKIFRNDLHIGYMDLISKIPENIAWVEYVILIVIAIVVVLAWYGILALIYLPFRKLSAKRRAKRAANNYILKKDYQNYKQCIKHQNEYSSKSETFMKIVEDDNKEEQAIADLTNAPKLEKDNYKPADYYDDLGHGVRDLGIGNIDEKPYDQAIIEREVRYISDKDFDVTLEAEPVIEVVEEDGIDTILQQYKEDELFYEKYQPNDIDVKNYEEYSKNRQEINDYVSGINGTDENEEVENKDLIEEKPVETKEEPVEEQPVVEKPEEPKEEDDGLTPLQRYQQERKRLLAERQALIDANALTEENDPLRKYRKPGARLGKVEARVPTVKQQEEQKRIKREQRAAKRKATMEAKAKLAAQEAKKNKGKK